MDEYSGSSSTQNERGSSPLHRAGELQPFIQEQCFEAVQAMAEQLQAALQQLGQPAMDLQGAHLVEQALLLGTRQISHAIFILIIIVIILIVIIVVVVVIIALIITASNLTGL